MIIHTVANDFLRATLLTACILYALTLLAQGEGSYAVVGGHIAGIRDSNIVIQALGPANIFNAPSGRIQLPVDERGNFRWYSL